MTTQQRNRSLQATLEDVAYDLGALRDCMEFALVAESVDNLQATLAETNKHLADLVFLAGSVADSYTGTHHILPSTCTDDNEVV